jgi:hypothetical protein
MTSIVAPEVRTRPAPWSPEDAATVTPLREPGQQAWERYVAEIARDLREIERRLELAERQLRVGHRTAREKPDAPSVRSVVAPIAPLVERRRAAADRLQKLRRSNVQTARPMLEVLGRERGLVHVGDRTVQLTPRHTEIIVILAHNEGGLTIGELALALHGEACKLSTMRGELSRVRRLLGRWIRAEDGRVRLDVDTDFAAVQRLLRAGRSRDAAQRYRAPLVPRSEAPGVVEARDELDAWVRSAIMTSEDREALWAWLESDSGRDDLPAWKRFLADLDFEDPRRPLAASRLTQLRGALTVVS